MKKVLFVIILFLFSIYAFGQEYDLMRLFPKITVIGDSLSSGELETDRGEFIDKYEYSWLSYICRKTGAKSKHYSNGGLTTETWLKTYYDTFEKEEYNAPCVFIALGTNDYDQNVPVGTITDLPKKDTFCGRYKQIINLVRKTNPNCVLFLCSLYVEGNPIMDKYSNIVKSLCDEYKNTYYIDITKCKNTLDKTNFKTVHPPLKYGHYNTVGYMLIGEEIYDLANELLNENIDDLKNIGL